LIYEVEEEISVNLTREQREKAKRYILETQIYKISAYIFLIVGVFLSIILGAGLDKDTYRRLLHAQKTKQIKCSQAKQVA